MGHMTKKHRMRLRQLEEELESLEKINKPRLAIKHRIKTLRTKALPKARRHAAKV